MISELKLLLWRTKMKNLNENAIREAAYYIWKNNGCPAGTSQQDWNLAIQQLSSNKSSSLLNNASSLLKTTSSAKKSNSKTSASKIAAPKKTSAKTAAKTTAKKSK
jgi:hypothetical protein